MQWSNLSFLLKLELYWWWHHPANKVITVDMSTLCFSHVQNHVNQMTTQLQFAFNLERVAYVIGFSFEYGKVNNVKI